MTKQHDANIGLAGKSHLDEIRVVWWGARPRDKDPNQADNRMLLWSTQLRHAKGDQTGISPHHPD